MRLSSLIATALVAVYVIANPLPSSQTLDAVVVNAPDGDLTHTVPTTAEIKRNMHTQEEMRNTSLFYSGPHGYRDEALTLAKNIGRHILTDFFLDPHYPEKWPDNNTEFWNHAPEAMAQVTSEIAYVLLQKEACISHKFYETSYWNRIEWPTLTKNPSVDAVVCVNLDDDELVTLYNRTKY